MKLRRVRTTRSSSLAEHEVFVRRAREAGHQALFLLLHVRSTRSEAINRVLERGLAFTFTQAQALVHSVAVPAVANDEAAAWFGARTVAPLGEPQDKGHTLFGLWRAVREAMDAASPAPREHVARTIAALRTFLDASHPKPWSVGMLDHVRMTIIRQSSRRVTTIIAVLAVYAILMDVQVVHSLIWNDTRKTPIFLLQTIGLSLTLWLIPLLGFWLSGFVGARAFWGLRALPPERGVERWPPDGGASRFISFAYTLTAIALLAWFGAFMWMGKVGVLDERRLTVFTILSLLSGVVFAAHVLDRWAFMERRAVRMTVLLFAVVLGGLVVVSQGVGSAQTESGLRIAAAITLLIPIGFELWRASQGIGSRVATAFLTVVYLSMAIGILAGAKVNRQRVWKNGDTQRTLVSAWRWPFPGDHDSPAVLVAASGGGSRAAYFTARTLELLEAAVVDGQANAIGAHIQAISSVSGGSLASAVYIARNYRRFRGEPTTLPQTQHPEFASTPAIITPIAAQGAPVTGMTEGLANAVKDDYLWPTIKGFLWPGTTRGDSIEKAWEDGPAALRGIDLGQLATAWEGAFGTAPPFPMPLFNSCTLDAQDVVISPLPRSLYSDSSSAAVSALRKHYAPPCPKEKVPCPLLEGDLTWVADRDGIYGLEQLLPSFTPSLSKAVRASANFPYGFPLVHLEVPPKNLVMSPRWTGEDTQTVAVKLTDGGALSNSGMWSLYKLMTLRAHTMAELKRRGVLLVIVEASSMPEYDQERSDLLALGSAIQNNNPRGQYLHREMLARLQRDFGDGLQVVQLDLTPSENANVLTTWSMDALSLAATEYEFVQARAREEGRLIEKWKALRARLSRNGVRAAEAPEGSGGHVSGTAPGSQLGGDIEPYLFRPPLN